MCLITFFYIIQNIKTGEILGVYDDKTQATWAYNDLGDSRLEYKLYESKFVQFKGVE